MVSIWIKLIKIKVTPPLLVLTDSAKPKNHIKIRFHAKMPDRTAVHEQSGCLGATTSATKVQRLINIHQYLRSIEWNIASSKTFKNRPNVADGLKIAWLHEAFGSLFCKSSWICQFCYQRFTVTNVSSKFLWTTTEVHNSTLMHILTHLQMLAREGL